MPLGPDYGQTPVSPDELDALLPTARHLLGEQATKAAVHDLERAIQEDVTEARLTAVISAGASLDDLVNDHYVRDLHRSLYGDIWTWGGLLRKRELNIGVAPALVAVELRTSLDSIRYRWQHTSDWTPRILGIACHAEIVRVHPFADGNGRTSRLIADLVFVAAQESSTPDLYDWAVDKRRYIDLLREYDRHRDPRDLAEFITVQALGQ